MELTNTFTVDSPIDVAWPVLCDIERIAPCMPGAQLQEVDGDVYKGEVKIKVGPIKARFKGTAEMVERDDDAHRAVLSAKGKDTGGKGNASAQITATAKAAGSGTEVTISTDLSITGKVAQFGRGALNDVSAKLLGQFVDCLENKVLAGDSADGAEGDGSPEGTAVEGGSEGAPSETPGGGAPPAAAGTPGASTATAAGGSSAATSGAVAGSSGPRKIDSPEAEPIDLLDAAGGTETAKKVAGPVAALMGIFFVIWWWRRRS